MASVFKRKPKGPWVIQWFDHTGRRRERSSRTTDRRAAERIANELEAQAALRREGVIDAVQDRLAEQNRRHIDEHLSAYQSYMKARERSQKHQTTTRRHLDRLIQQQDASRLSDFSGDSVSSFLGSLRSDALGARTINAHLESVRAFFNWCVRSGRLERNPVVGIQKLDENRDRRRVRRPLSDKELRRLLEVAGQVGRRAWYLTAAYAGLRASELKRLTWGAIDFQSGVLTIRDGKAHRVDEIPLHPDLARELAALKPSASLPTARVFPTAVTNQTRQKDFLRAKIPLEDEEGRFADLHSLRSTLGTWLARQGVTPQVAQKLMRHASYETTLKHYTHLTRIDTRQAIHGLPNTTEAKPAAATGTNGPEQLKAPQQIPQQSEHESLQHGASPCEDSDSSSVDCNKPKGPRRNNSIDCIATTPETASAR